MSHNKKHRQSFLPGLFPQEIVEQAISGINLPLEVDSAPVYDNQERPELPARWEATQLLAQRRNALPVVLRQIRPVPAIDYLSYLLGLSRDEGYTWVVYGASGCGKSTFFHTLQHQTNDGINTHIIDARKINLSDQASFSNHLEQVIVSHKTQKGENKPLVIVLEERENEMSTEERSSIVQSLKNILRPPGPGKNVIFVYPVTNSNIGTLFLEQARDTGVSVPLGHNSIYTFQGPPHTEHVDIVRDLFIR